MTELQPGIPFAREQFTIVPIEAVQSDSCPRERGFWAWGFKEPVALVLCGPSEIRAVDILGNEVDLNELVEKVAGLQAVLEQFSGSWRH